MLTARIQHVAYPFVLVVCDTSQLQALREREAAVERLTRENASLRRQVRRAKAVVQQEAKLREELKVGALPASTSLRLLPPPPPPPNPLPTARTARASAIAVLIAMVPLLCVLRPDECVRPQTDLQRVLSERQKLSSLRADVQQAIAASTSPRPSPPALMQPREATPVDNAGTGSGAQATGEAVPAQRSPAKVVQAPQATPAPASAHQEPTPLPSRRGSVTSAPTSDSECVAVVVAHRAPQPKCSAHTHGWGGGVRVVYCAATLTISPFACVQDVTP